MKTGGYMSLKTILSHREAATSGFAALLIGVTFLLTSLYAGSRQGSADGSQQKSADSAIAAQQPAVKVTITTGGGLFGPVRDHYRVGQRIPVVITMSDTRSDPVPVCVSGTLYQDQPKLLKDGQPVPFMKAQREMLQTVYADKTCATLDLPEPIMLKPNEPTMVDWFVLAEGTTERGDLSWYEPLQVGKYELSIRRRFDCCDGPTVESNKINFEVVP
jgi:hypothetical protein